MREQQKFSTLKDMLVIILGFDLVIPTSLERDVFAIVKGSILHCLCNSLRVLKVKDNRESEVSGQRNDAKSS